MNEALWYFGRGAGVAALVLFSLVVVLGLVVRTGRPVAGVPRFVITAVHRTISLTAVGLLTAHVVSLLFDRYAQLRVVDVIVPFLGSYRPLWQGLGTLALDLVVLLVVSSLLRARIGLRTWRVLHWTAYLCWPAAVLHAVGNGTNGTSTWMLAIVGACVAAVIATGIWRWAVTAPVAATPAVTPPAGLAGLR